MRSTMRMLTTGLCGGVIAVSATATGWTATPPPAPVSLRAAIHVHSTMSTGSLNLESLARRAEQQGLDVLILSENFSLRYDYGPYPFDGFLKYQVTFPDVMEFGVPRFLEEVHAVQQRYPKLIIIPGVEVAPHYYWTGSLLQGDLTMHNAQRNLLVLGLDRGDDYEQLPSYANPHSFVWTWQSVTNVLPFLLLIAIVAIWRHSVFSQSEIQRAESRSRHVFAGTLTLLCLGLLINAWPMKMPRYGSHESSVGYRPYQDLIDRAIERGALVFWSMTEARDFSRHSFGPLGTVTVKTEPHPEALVLTHGYTGFGGLYQDARRAVAPGGVWDQLLQSRVPNGSGGFPTMIGEVAFHGTSDPGKDLDQVYTVIHAVDRTAAGIMDALRFGRAYAVARGDQNVLLRLDEFRISRHGASAQIGEILEGSKNGDIHIRVRLSAFDEKAHGAKLRVIRSGQVLRQIEGATPLELELVDRGDPSEGWVNYRLEVVGASGELLTNPIYVAPTDRVNAAGQPRTAGLRKYPVIG